MAKNNYEGEYGFKNGAPAHASNNTSSVDLFLHTWDFLPNDRAFETLTKEQLTKLCVLALDATCRINLDGSDIKTIQRLMNDFGLSPDAKRFNIPN